MPQDGNGPACTASADGVLHGNRPATPPLKFVALGLAPPPPPDSPAASLAQDLLVLSEAAGLITIVPIQTVVMIEAEGNYSRAVMRPGKSVLVRRTLNEWKAVLPAGAFCRLDRSLIAALSAIREVRCQPRGTGVLFLSGQNDPLRLIQGGTHDKRANKTVILVTKNRRGGRAVRADGPVAVGERHGADVLLGHPGASLWQRRRADGDRHGIDRHQRRPGGRCLAGPEHPHADQ